MPWHKHPKALPHAQSREGDSRDCLSVGPEASDHQADRWGLDGFHSTELTQLEAAVIGGCRLAAGHLPEGVFTRADLNTGAGTRGLFRRAGALTFILKYHLSTGRAVTKLAPFLAAGGGVVFRVAGDTWTACAATSRYGDGAAFTLFGSANARLPGFGDFVAGNHDTQNGGGNICGDL